MLEARGVIKDIANTVEAIEEIGAAPKGTYAFRDVIFVPREGHRNLNDSFVRVRVYSESNWETKHVVVVWKKTDFNNFTKTDHILLRREFDDEWKAIGFIEKEMGEEFEKGFEYSRTGQEFGYKSSKIFVEDIEGFGPTIEIEAKSQEELDTLFRTLGITERIRDTTAELMRKKMHPGSDESEHQKDTS